MKKQALFIVVERRPDRDGYHKIVRCVSDFRIPDGEWVIDLPARLGETAASSAAYNPRTGTFKPS